MSDAGENLFGPADVAEQVGAVRRTTSTTTMRGVLAKRFNRLMCQYRLKIPHSAGRKVRHRPEMKVYSFSRLVENETGW